VTEKILFSMCDFTLGDFLISAFELEKLKPKIFAIYKRNLENNCQIIYFRLRHVILTEKPELWERKTTIYRIGG